jgi:hypothetical protein
MIRAWRRRRRELETMYDAVFARYVERRDLTVEEAKMLEHFHDLCEVAGYRDGVWNTLGGRERA